MNRCIAKPPKPQAPDFKAAATRAESTETSITCPFHTAWAPKQTLAAVSEIGRVAWPAAARFLRVMAAGPNRLPGSERHAPALFQCRKGSFVEQSTGFVTF